MLSFFRVSRKETGQYKCQAKNTAGEANKIINLQVLGKIGNLKLYSKLYHIDICDSFF